MRKEPLREKSDWDVVWTKTKFPKRFNLKTCFGAEFNKLMHKYIVPKSKILEIGCASAQFLIYFKEHFDCDIYGMDYSEQGCQMANQNLKAADVRGNIICDDIFESNRIEKGFFDIVFSGGFIEHFEDTGKVVEKHLDFLKDDGLLIIELPNMSGLHGFIFRVFNKDLYFKHKPLTLNMVKEVFESFNISILEAGYIGSIILESGGKPRWTVPFFYTLNKMVYFLTSIFNFTFNHPNYSPYMIIVGKKGKNG